MMKSGLSQESEEPGMQDRLIMFLSNHGKPVYTPLYQQNGRLVNINDEQSGQWCVNSTMPSSGCSLCDCVSEIIKLDHFPTKEFHEASLTLPEVPSSQKSIHRFSSMVSSLGAKITEVTCLQP